MLEIEVRVYEGTTIKEGKKFNYYKAVQSNGTLIDLKFRKEVTPLPKETSTIYVKPTDINKDSNRVYPCLWVKEVQSIQPVKREIKADDEVLEMFTGVNEDDLPF